MIIQTRIVKCDNKNCQKKLTVEGNGWRGAYLAVKENGWQWKSAEVQFCKEHRTKVEKKSVKAKPKKEAKKSATKPKAKPVKKDKPLVDVQVELDAQDAGE